jgi:peptidylprolyl isomerase
MKKLVSLLLAGAAAVALASPPAYADEKAEKKSESKMVKTGTGLQYEDVVVGTGAQPHTGQTCLVHYTVWLWENGAKGRKVDSSVDRGKPLEFQLGVSPMIKGWTEGVSTMKVGGKRNLLVPPQIGYGIKGSGDVIPPNATLFFELELVGTK